ncbi:hypothetical protein BD626DRAFT_222660 [Schizophyllum amplum]|uniref:C2H2-type domain-containing protein n=1 Tax=Schizophyllum amplum TaxID=97359 RepID=A0A550BXJ1_9AGAR|nr:hypothetical protein BD626DRAFT_222660 [Auriculariopsis ampla]
MSIQLPIEELTRLCVHAQLSSSSDESITLSVRPSPQGIPHAQPLPPPTGYQINFEIKSTSQGATLVVSVTLPQQEISSEFSGSINSHGERSSVDDPSYKLFIEKESTPSGLPNATYTSGPSDEDLQSCSPVDPGFFPPLYNDLNFFPLANATVDSMQGLTDPMILSMLAGLSPLELASGTWNQPPKDSTASPTLQTPVSPVSPAIHSPVLQPPPSSSSSSPSLSTSPSGSPALAPNVTPRKRKSKDEQKPRTLECTMGCEESFSRQHDRFRHEVLKHGRPCDWVCDTCHKFFGSQKNLDKHACNKNSRWTAPT